MLLTQYTQKLIPLTSIVSQNLFNKRLSSMGHCDTASQSLAKVTSRKLQMSENYFQKHKFLNDDRVF